MKTPLFFLLGLFSCGFALGQIDASKIDIVRDEYGVPHVFAATDAEVAYGLAYAHSEDDFKTIQISNVSIIVVNMKKDF